MGKRVRVQIRDFATAVAYIRVSTDEQHLGPDAQREAIERWAEARGVKVVSWHVDKGVSGGSEIAVRPGLTQALTELESSTAGILVAARRDRFGRRRRMVLDLEERLSAMRVRLVSAAGEGSDAQPDDPDAVLQSGLSDLLAEHFRLLVKSRTRAALRVKKARGERVGSIPFGFRLAPDGVHLEPEPSEQATIERVRQLDAEGMSMRAIVLQLTQEGVQARRGRWHLTQVARILRAA